MKPLAPSEFRDAIRKGKGSAYLHVCRYGDAGVQKALLEACRRDLRYDSQCEDNRKEWIYAILAASAHPDRYLKAILRTLMASMHTRKTEYVLDLAGQFALRGNEEARLAIRAKFLRWRSQDPEAFAGPMMDADGLDGFLQAADAIGAQLNRENEWFADCYFDDAKERFGEKKVNASLVEGAEGSPGTRRFVRALRRGQQRHPPPKRPKPTLRQVLRWIGKGPSRPPMNLYGFARSASGRNLQIVFNRMLMEERPEVACRYLRVFFHRELPRLDPRIFDWARSTDAGLHHSAMVALSKIKHETVRDFALERFHRRVGSPDWRGLDLLERNWVRGDGRWIRQLLPQKGEAAVLHGVALSLINLPAARRDETMAPCLLWVYEQTPCSMCREGAIRNLIRLRRAPRWLVQEAVHDSDERSRQVAARALARQYPRSSRTRCAASGASIGG